MIRLLFQRLWAFLFVASVVAIQLLPRQSAAYVVTCRDLSNPNPHTDQTPVESLHSGQIASFVRHNFANSYSDLQTRARRATAAAVPLSTRQPTHTHLAHIPTPSAASDSLGSHESHADHLYASTLRGEGVDKANLCQDPSIDESDPKYRLCADVLGAPISAAPIHFTQYQAVGASNQVFTSINRIYRNLDARRTAGLQAGAKGTHSEPTLRDPLHHLDVVQLHKCATPQIAIARFFGNSPLLPFGHSFPNSRAACTTSDPSGASCENPSLPSEHSGFFDSFSPGSATSIAHLYLFPPDPSDSGISPSTPPFPKTILLVHQHISDVPSPPPKI